MRNCLCVQLLYPGVGVVLIDFSFEVFIPEGFSF